MLDQPDSPGPSGPGLSFHLAEKHEILVVSFVGKIVKANDEILAQCAEGIASSGARSVVLNLLGVADIDKPGLQLFAKLQLNVRSKPADLRICFLKPKIKSLLNEAGILRPEELRQDLKEAIVSVAFKRAA